MPFKHATVILDGVEIPLISVPTEATLEECDLCHDLFHISVVRWTGTQILCKKCLKDDERKTMRKGPGVR